VVANPSSHQHHALNYKAIGVVRSLLKLARDAGKAYKRGTEALNEKK